MNQQRCSNIEPSTSGCVELSIAMLMCLGCGSAATPNPTTHGDAFADRDVVQRHLASAGYAGEILRVNDRGNRWEVSFAAQPRESHTAAEQGGNVVLRSPIQTLSVAKADGRVSKAD